MLGTFVRSPLIIARNSIGLNYSPNFAKRGLSFYDYSTNGYLYSWVLVF